MGLESVWTFWIRQKSLDPAENRTSHRRTQDLVTKSSELLRLTSSKQVHNAVKQTSNQSTWPAAVHILCATCQDAFSSLASQQSPCCITADTNRTQNRCVQQPDTAANEALHMKKGTSFKCRHNNLNSQHKNPRLLNPCSTATCFGHYTLQ